LVKLNYDWADASGYAEGSRSVELHKISLSKEAKMADQILVQVQNVSGDTAFRASVFDLFGGGTREVDGSPFNLSPRNISPQFSVFVDQTGNGAIRCLDANGEALCPDATVPNNNNNIVTFPP
jgi:hypothetical protein